MDSQTVLLLHVAVSFMALPLGLVAIMGYFVPTPPLWTRWFLAGAVATVITGFLFPLTTLTPATAVGLLATAVLGVMALARYAFGLSGIWLRVHALGMVISTYFLAFVLVAQAFLKLPPLKALAPTGTEAPFAMAQLVLLVLFVWIGFRVLRKVG